MPFPESPHPPPRVPSSSPLICPFYLPCLTQNPQNLETGGFSLSRAASCCCRLVLPSCPPFVSRFPHYLTHSDFRSNHPSPLPRPPFDQLLSLCFCRGAAVFCQMAAPCQPSSPLFLISLPRFSLSGIDNNGWLWRCSCPPPLFHSTLLSLLPVLPSKKGVLLSRSPSLLRCVDPSWRWRSTTPRNTEWRTWSCSIPSTCPQLSRTSVSGKFLSFSLSSPFFSSKKSTDYVAEWRGRGLGGRDRKTIQQAHTDTICITGGGRRRGRPVQTRGRRGDDDSDARGIHPYSLGNKSRNK